MTRIVTALYDTAPQAELALAHLAAEVGVEEGEIVERSIAGRTRLARMNLSPEERAVCERELEAGGYLLIARVDRTHDADHIVSLLKNIPIDGLGKAGRTAPAGGDYLGFRVEDPGAATTAPAAPAATGTAAALRAAPPHAASAPAGGRSGGSEGFWVEEPKAAQPAAASPPAPSAPSAPAVPAEAAAEAGQRRVGAWEGFRVEDPAAAPAAPAAAAPAETVIEERVPIVEEELRIGTREVLRGGARVHAHVEEHPVREAVELLAEHTSIERRPAGRRLSEEELEQGGLLRERVIEISEMREEAIVSKEAFVREEVIVKKTVERRTEMIEETVRRTEVEAERLPGPEHRPALGGLAPADRPEGVRR
jgi:stress response protein YsnF